jgi:hypothetical protein
MCDSCIAAKLDAQAKENEKLREETEQLRVDLLLIDQYCRANDIDVEEAFSNVQFKGNVESLLKTTIKQAKEIANIKIRHKALGVNLETYRQRIAALTAENDKIRELVIHQIPCIRGLGVENDTSQTPTLDLVKVVVNENEKLKNLLKELQDKITILEQCKKAVDFRDGVAIVVSKIYYESMEAENKWLKEAQEGLVFVVNEIKLGLSKNYGDKFKKTIDLIDKNMSEILSKALKDTK